VLEIEEVGRLAREAEGAVYFAMSEAITNAIKHADAPIRVQLHRSDGAVEFAIADSGPGFDPATAVGGSGLANLADRIETAGGELRIDTTPASRTVVWARIPVGDDHLRSVSGDGRPE
jgi:signal transduction histidine kinase